MSLDNSSRGGREKLKAHTHSNTVATAPKTQRGLWRARNVVVHACMFHAIQDRTGTLGWTFINKKEKTKSKDIESHN